MFTRSDFYTKANYIHHKDRKTWWRHSCLVHLLHGGKDLLNGVVLLRSALAQAPSSPCCSDYRLLQRGATGLLRRCTGRESLRRRTGWELRRREARECCRSAEAQRAAQEAGAATARVARGRSGNSARREGPVAARGAGGRRAAAGNCCGVAPVRLTHFF